MALETAGREGEDDLSLAIRMMDGDQEALSIFLRRNAGKVTGALRAKYYSLPEAVLGDAVNRAAYAIWRNAAKFDDRKGSLGGLFYRIATREVVNVLREGEKAPTVNIDDLQDSIAAPDKSLAGAAEDRLTPLTPQKKKLYEDLHQIIASLPYYQRTITEADLVAGCEADNAYLAEVLRTSKNAVYVSRNKAREKIRQEMRKKGHYQ